MSFWSRFWCLLGPFWPPFWTLLGVQIGQNRSKIGPKIDQNFDVMLVSFLVPLGSLLASLLDPLGRPNRSKSLQNASRDLVFFCQKKTCSRNHCKTPAKIKKRPKAGPKIGSRWPQDAPKTVLKSVFFALENLLRF